MEEQLLFPLSCPTADCLAVSHSVSLIHITHVTVTVCHSIWFCCVALFITEIFFLWLIMNVSMQMSLLSVYCFVVMSPLVVIWMSSPLSSTVLYLRSSGIPSLFMRTVSQQLIFFFVVRPSKSWWEKSNCPCTICGHILQLSLLFLSLWYGLLSAVSLCRSCHLPSILSCIQLCNLCSLMKKFVLLGNIFSEYIIPLNKTITSSVAIFSEGLWNLENVLFRISNMSCISYILSVSFLCVHSISVVWNVEIEGCVNTCSISSCWLEWNVKLVCFYLLVYLLVS